MRKIFQEFVESLDKKNRRTSEPLAAAGVSLPFTTVLEDARMK